jgi:hypothetical protein
MGNAVSIAAGAFSGPWRDPFPSSAAARHGTFPPVQQMGRQMNALPFTCRIFAGLRPSRISMNGAQYLVQTQTTFHCQHEFRQQVAGAFGYNRYARIRRLHSYHLHGVTGILAGNLVDAGEGMLRR